MDVFKCFSKPLGYISWPVGSSTKQSFSFHGSLIYYITQNPSTPKAYLKLAESCKYFFEKNPIIITKRINNFGKKFCSNGEENCRKNNRKCCVKIDVYKLKSKIWLTHLLGECEIQNIAAILLPKLYRCENALLEIWRTRMTLDDLKLWVPKFQKLFLLHVNIVDNGGKTIMLENILESIPDIKEFSYQFCHNYFGVTRFTIKNISKNNNLCNLQLFHLIDVPGIFSVEDFEDLFKNLKSTAISLEFRWNISQQYMNQLDELIDDVVNSNVSNRLIRYIGQDNEKLNYMKSRFHY